MALPSKIMNPSLLSLKNPYSSLLSYRLHSLPYKKLQKMKWRREIWVNIDQGWGQVGWILAKFFFACLWTKTESRSISTQKRNEELLTQGKFLWEPGFNKNPALHARTPGDVLWYPTQRRTWLERSPRTFSRWRRRKWRLPCEMHESASKTRIIRKLLNTARYIN